MSSDSSDLSSVPSDDELDLQLKRKDGILKFFSKAPKGAPKPKVEASPPRKKRDPSPEHEYVLADNPDIAFIVMFRSRFTEAFPKSLANFGPQELERDVVDGVPGEGVEHLLCALLGLLLNRKQDVKAGHYNRALEEAIQTHKAHWAKDWESKNPLSGGATFTTMVPTQRLTLLRTLILWSLSSSDIVRGIIITAYKQSRHEDDLNQPLSIQPWGSDGDRRRYYLIEGLDDTHFRVYRESSHTGIKRTWWSVASDIDELKALAEKLSSHEYDGGQKARTLSSKMLAAVPRFEATEEKRKRREYRQIRKHQFKRPEPGFSLYEGRTRGKRMRYTYSDDEEDAYSDSTSARRSTRNTGTHTPAEPTGPTVTLSGRQVKSRMGGTYGESMLSGQTATVSAFDGAEDEPEDEAGRPKRAAAVNHGTNGWTKPKGGRHIAGYNDVDEMMSDEEDDASEQDYGDDEEEEQASLPSEADDHVDEASMDEGLEDEAKKTLVVKLPMKTPTPEKQTAVDLCVSPEEDRQPINLFKSTANSAEDELTEASTQGTTGLALEDTIPKLPTTPEEKSPTSGATTKPLSILPISSQIPTAPSPLVFRGSPDKHTQLPATSVNVGYEGP